MIARFHVNVVLIMVIIILSAASAVVVLQGASDEPYASFSASDALIQIGVAMVLMTLWLQLALFLGWAVALGRASKMWLLLLIWIAVCEFIFQKAPEDTFMIWCGMAHWHAKGSNHAMERTADRSAFTFEMTSTLPLRAMCDRKRMQDESTVRYIP